MTKPNEFYMNTDYLPLAETGKNEFTAYFGPETLSGGTQIERTSDFTVKATKGAIDRMLISRNGSPYRVGDSVWNHLSENQSTAIISFWVHRINASTIRVRYRAFTGNPSFNVPAQTIKVKIASFEPPNVF
jgi:hypothetical protein